MAAWRRNLFFSFAESAWCLPPYGSTLSGHSESVRLMLLSAILISARLPALGVPWASWRQEKGRRTKMGTVDGISFPRMDEVWPDRPVGRGPVINSLNCIRFGTDPWCRVSLWVQSVVWLCSRITVQVQPVNCTEPYESHNIGPASLDNPVSKKVSSQQNCPLAPPKAVSFSCFEMWSIRLP